LTTEAVIAANRFGLGARQGELKTIGSGARDWLAEQVRGSRRTPDAISSLPSSAQAFRDFLEGQEARRENKKKKAQSTPEAEVAQRVVQGVRQKLVPLYLDQVAARYRVATATREPFRERLVHFWTNHFAVSADKAAVTGLAGTLENEAIRPHIAGRFVDMLMAVESHPAMIFYLDNQASIGPHSRLAERAAHRARQNDRKLDINENLAREIMELHTLGVNGGYTQADVTTFALALTGWSIGGGRGPLKAGEPGKFEFRDAIHEPGARTILGKRYGEDGVAQPRAILKDLAAHSSTATHLATKLVRHFVADDPPADAVAQVARVFRDSEGDLPAVHRALLAIPAVWQAPPPKFKTPHEFVVSTFRMFDYVPPEPKLVAAPFELLGQRPYSPGSPAGWPDTADRWDGPDALLKRIEWATAVGERVGARYQPIDLGAQSLGDSFQEHTRVAVSRASSAAQGVTLLLVSPEFQRR
jgi:uncharacterized protein (DUF1800 family)